MTWGVVGMSGGVASVASCTKSTPFSYEPTTNNHANIGWTTNEYYYGTTFTPDTNITVCKISLKLEVVQGSLTGKTITVGIYENNYNANLVTALATATNTGASVNGASLDFTFASPYTCVSGHTYSIVADVGGVDQTNVCGLDFDSTTYSWTYGLYSYWKQDKTSSSADSSTDIYIKIWGQ
jgi:hypothetical protein